MKTYVLSILFFLLVTSVFSQEYKIITTVESIATSGLGHSRILDSQGEADHKKLTRERTDGRLPFRSEWKPEQIQIHKFEETTLLNFYSWTRIDHQNIATNDALVSSKLSDLSKDGWVLAFVTSAVESDGGESDGKGIFITRYIFRREKKKDVAIDDSN